MTETEYRPGEAAARAMRKLAAEPAVGQALERIREDHPRRIEEQCRITLIPAPTFHEEKRAAYMTEQFRALGLADVHTDASGSAVGIRRGSEPGPAVLVDGHMDTVYPEDTPLRIVNDGEFIHCPGINDDASALGGMLALLRGMNAAGIRTRRDLIFLGSVREEGIGGFGGVRAFFDEHPGSIAASIHLDGAGAAGVIYQATGFKTIEVTFHGAGGHAYNDFGSVSNALHAAARAVAKIADLQVPAEPKTTFCVSNFHAGCDAGIHAIVPEAVIKINYRSNGAAELAALDRQITACIDAACAEETARWGRNAITSTVKTYVDIPAASLGVHDPLVEAAWCAAETAGNRPYLVKGGPTNASIPISRGIPAVCLGNSSVPLYSHDAVRERFPVKNSWQMPQVALLTILSAAGTAGTEPVL